MELCAGLVALLEFALESDKETTGVTERHGKTTVGGETAVGGRPEWGGMEQGLERATGR
jgi:hypothetical protein